MSGPDARARGRKIDIWKDRWWRQRDWRARPNTSSICALSARTLLLVAAAGRRRRRMLPAREYCFRQQPHTSGAGWLARYAAGRRAKPDTKPSRAEPSWACLAWPGRYVGRAHFAMLTRALTPRAAARCDGDGGRLAGRQRNHWAAVAVAKAAAVARARARARGASCADAPRKSRPPRTSQARRGPAAAPPGGRADKAHCARLAQPARQASRGAALSASIVIYRSSGNGGRRRRRRANNKLQPPPPPPPGDR